MPSKNPEIIKKHRDAWYQRNKEKQIARQKERRADLQKWFKEFKRTLSCFDCKMSFETCPEVLDFHHLDPSKKEGQAHDMILKSQKSLLLELEKCIPLCANCHRIRHRVE